MTIPNIIRRSWRDPDTREIYEWAGGGNITLPAAYSLAGPFSVQPSRYLMRPFEAIRSHKVRMVTIAKATQTAGTLLADISVPWFCCNRPGPVMWNMQTVEIAHDHALTRAVPVIRACRALRHLLPSDPRALNKGGVDFPHMPLWIQGSTPAALQSKSVLFLINDEVWQWEQGRLAWALARVTAFERVGMSKVLTVSQPGKAGDDFDKLWKSSSRRDLLVRCDGCREYFTPEWTAKGRDGEPAGMIWDRDERTCPEGEWNIDEAVKTVRYRCQLCGHEHRDSAELKARWNASVQWTGPAEFCEHEGFRWAGIHVDGWAGMLRQWLEARRVYHLGVLPPTITFLQQRACLVDDPARDEDEDEVPVGDHDPESDWPDEVARFMTVDVQIDHFWIVVRAWAESGDSRALWAGRVDLEQDVQATAERFRVHRRDVRVDVRFQRGEKREVFALCARNKWHGLMGEDRDYYTHGTSRTQYLFSDKQKKFARAVRKGEPVALAFAYYRRFSAPRVKDILAALMSGRGAKWTGWEGKDYARQLHAEYKSERVNPQTGRSSWTWKQKAGRPNHLWDCECMQVVCALQHPGIALET